MIETRLLAEMPPGWTPGAAWLRVSSDGQNEANQEPDVERYCEHHQIWVVQLYVLHDVSAYKGEQEDKLRAMLEDARRGLFKVLVVWASDRIERRGIERVLRLVRQLRERNARLECVLEPWLSGREEQAELLQAITAWKDEQESKRKSERIRAGMARRRRDLEAGRPVKGRQAMGGRVRGSRNKKPRPKLTGERAGWTPERKAALAARNAQRQWTPEQKLEAARISHRRTCPVTDCMETRAHG